MNRYKKHCKRLLKVALCLLGFALAKFFCEDVTKGFTFVAIDRNIPYDPILGSPDEFKEKEQVLSQPFYFLDRGGQSYVFISQDQKIVFKFFKKQYNVPDNLILAIDHLLSSSLKKYRFEFFKTRKERLYPIFESCTIANQHLKDQTALLYLHFNPTKDLPPLEIVDNLGIHHKLDLNTTSFLVQKRGELIFSCLETHLSKNDLEGAKKLIHNIFTYILTRSQQGIRDNDNGLNRNYGYIEDQAISIDVGAFVYDDSLKDPLLSQKELERKTRQLGQWLADFHPELLPYFEEKLRAGI